MNKIVNHFYVVSGADNYVLDQLISQGEDFCFKHDVIFSNKDILTRFYNDDICAIFEKDLDKIVVARHNLLVMPNCLLINNQKLVKKCINYYKKINIHSIRGEHYQQISPNEDQISLLKYYKEVMIKHSFNGVILNEILDCLFYGLQSKEYKQNQSQASQLYEKIILKR
ncbi:MAG: hypothetical protein RR847_01665 [Bacilli bacterium]